MLLNLVKSCSPTCVDISSIYLAAESVSIPRFCASPGNYGCRGGWMYYAYKYVKDNDGIDTPYNYEAQVTNTNLSHVNRLHERLIV